METDLLRTFTAVVRAGTFTAAARGARLDPIHRDGAPAVPGTAPGNAAARPAFLRCGAHRRRRPPAALRRAAARPRGPHGRRRSGQGRALGGTRPTGGARVAYRLPPAGPACPTRGTAPDVRLALAPAGTAPALAAVRAGAVEAALLLEPTITAADLHLEHLRTEELTLLAAPDAADLHRPGQSGQDLTWAQLAQQEVLLLEDGCSYSDDVVRQLLATGLPAHPLRQH